MKISNRFTGAVVSVLALHFLCGSALATDSENSIRVVEAEAPPAVPKGLAPLVGLAKAQDVEPGAARKYAWKLIVYVPKVQWEAVSKTHPVFHTEYIELETKVEMIRIDMELGYSRSTAIVESRQNRLVDLKGRRLAKEEVFQRLNKNTPVLISVSEGMPDPFYLRHCKSDTMILIVGDAHQREVNLLPTSH